MPEEIKSGDNGGLNPEPQKPKDIVLTITLAAETGHLAVQGPGNGKLFDLPKIFYLMEIAKDHVKAVNKAQSQSQIIQARPRIKDVFRRH
jgi:hypothetical protein